MTFELRRESPVDTMGVVFQEYIDSESGAKHIHLKSESSENCFMVSFPTIPHSDDGRAHILEHLSLCGSEKYPTRDPFFSMSRRSLATFMNAMTYPDRTVYPFASQDKQDFMNLLDVYLDAAFFPKLNRIDFLQEGWRLAFDEQGQLQYNGVVFNEMKEPMSNPGRNLWHGIQVALKPGTTYASESGGDPLSIPELSHEELVAFHKTHYHPSRATFWTYGNIDPEEIQARIQSEVISKIKTRLPRVQPDSAALPSAPIQASISLPSHGEGNEHGVHFGWILGEIGKDREKINHWQIFQNAIIGDSASPMNMAIENAGYGRPTGIVGLDSNSRQVTFHLGMDGLSEDEIPKAKKLIFDTLESIAQKGVPESRLKFIVRDFELSARDIRGGSTPYGLNTLLSMAATELNGGDPLYDIDTEADLAQALIDIQDPDFIKNMAHELLTSAHRLDAVSIPDPEFSIKREAAEAKALADVQMKLTAKEVADIKKDSEDLLARQRAKDDVSCLPKIKPSEISREIPVALPVEFIPNEDKASRAFIETASNGVGKFSVIMDASRIGAEDWPWLNLGTNLTTHLGFGDLNYEQAELYRSERCSGFSASSGASNASESSASAMALRVNYTSKALEREAASMAEAVCATLNAPRFDEHERIAFLIQSSYQSTLQNIAGSAAGMASNASTAPFGALGAYSSATTGIAKLRFLEKIDALSRTPEGLQEIQSRIENVFKKMAQAPAVLIYQGSREASELAFAAADQCLSSRTGYPSLDAVDHPAPFKENTELGSIALTGPGQVNYCHAAWKSPQTGDPDCGPMLVLGAFLRNTFLHRALREEGGAYGGSASQSSVFGAFTMSSYRDPRFADTYKDFESAIDAAVSGPISQDDLEDAIISVVKSLDKPGTPFEEAGSSLSREMAGTTQERRLFVRHSILDCTAEDLRRVAKKYLLGAPSNKAAYTCPKSYQEAIDQGFHCVEVAPTSSRTMKIG